MKLTAILLLAAALQVSAKGFGQAISLNLKNASLEKAIKEIEKQSGFSFVYGKEQLAQSKAIDLTVNNEKLEKVLELIFKDQPLSFTISGKYIALKQKAPITVPVILGQGEGPPPIDVHGRVLNDNGEPVEGAIVTVKGTNKRVATNANGEFTLNGIDANATLVVSAVNIETNEIKIAGKTDIAINVKAKVTTGDEVKVEAANTGYQTIPKETATGSFATIDNETINRSLSTDIISRIKDVTSGLLQQGNGANRLTPIHIRGLSTILANTQPLVVVDNFPYEGNIDNINPNDIENVTILKDAAAASIWGVRAGNGVIVITTKKGKYNQPIKVTLNTSFQIADKPDFFYSPIMNSSDYIDVETFLFGKGLYNSNITSTSRPALSPVQEILLKRQNGVISTAESALQIDALRNNNVQNDLSKYYYQKMVNQQYSLNLSGGGINNQYYVSVGYDNNLPSQVGNQYQRTTINANNTFALLKRKLEVTMGVWYAQTKSLSNSTSYSSSLPTFGAGVVYPYAQLADVNGNHLNIARNRQGYIDTAGAGKLLDWTYRPLDEINLADNKTTGINYRINLNVKYKIIPHLDFDVKYLFERGETDTRNEYNQQTFYTRNLINLFSSINNTSGIVTRPLPLGSIIDLNNTDYNSQNFRGQLNYANSWNNKKHQLSFIGGAERREIKTNGISNRVYGYNDQTGSTTFVDFVTPFKNYITGGSTSILQPLAITASDNIWISTFANAAYTYQNKYTLSGSVRRDGTNLVGVNTNNKYVPLWSTGISWDISKENFFNIKWFSFLKLRATYGYAGNVDPTLASLLTISNISTPNQWNLQYNGLRNPPNPDLRWEKTNMYNFGLDFSAINNRISGSVEYYYKSGIDLIGSAVLAPSSGQTSYKGNTANMKGKGLDVVITSRNTTGKIKWATTLLFSYSADWVTSYKVTQTSIQAYVNNNGLISPIIGRPVTALYSFKWAGLSSTGDPLGLIAGVPSNNWAGLISSSNLNDMVYNGPSLPPFFGSIRNSLSWKQLSASFNITYKFGYYFRRPSINYSNLFNRSDVGNRDYALRWKQPGDENITNVPSLIYPGNFNRDLFYNYSEILVNKGDQIRLQDIQLSYDLVKKKTSKLPFKNLRLYIYASNLGLLWKANKEGIDPDNVPQNSIYTNRNPKMFAGGVKIDF